MHAIQGWDDLRSRLRENRMCFAFFHPAMGNDPLVFVEVALVDEIPDAIAPLIDRNRETIAADKVNTVVFYSISNCHPGLAGISFGNFLIKQVASELRSEFPHLTRFETLSPIPGFRGWVSASLKENATHTLPAPIWDRLRTYLEDIDDDFDANPLAQDTLLPLCAHYLTHEKKGQQPIDPVARFHLGNGAMLHNVHTDADHSEKGLQQAYGCMVNYLYELKNIEKNHEDYVNNKKVIFADKLKKYT